MNVANYHIVGFFEGELFKDCRHPKFQRGKFSLQVVLFVYQTIPFDQATNFKGKFVVNSSRTAKKKKKKVP